MKTRGELEAAVSQALVGFLQEHLGRGPRQVRSYLLGRLVLVHLQGTLSPAEQRLARSDRQRARELIKQARFELIDQARPALESALRNVLETKVVSVHTDLSTRTGESVFVFSLDREPALPQADSAEAAGKRSPRKT